MRNYISKPDSLLKQIWKDRDVNIVEKTHSLGRRKFNLIDISLNGHGQDEDRKYIQSRFYRTNIRRGNTIIEDPKKQYCQFARKGTPKILDIKLEHVQYFNKKSEIGKVQRNVAQIIFEGVNIAFQEGKKVELIKTQKLNGQNAQISYNYQFDGWIICSKNVSLLAAYPEDLQIYKEPRYHYALMMAEQWFKEIKKLTPSKIKELKKLLDGYTIIGQYCGNPQYQHLVRYQEVGIIWFALVDNFSQEYCIDPLKTKRQLQKFGFKVAKIKSIIFTSSSQSFYSALQKLYLKTAQASIEDLQFGMEGSIVYFVIPQIDRNGVSRQTTVGAGKLKTLEYRFFRKIREKVSRFITKNEKVNDLVKNYKKQIIQLEQANSSKAPFPYQYYIKILNSCIDLADFTQMKEEKLRGNFISILKIIFYAIYKRISIKNYGRSMLDDTAFVQKVSQIPFLRYNGLGCNTKIIYIVIGLPGMFKSYLASKISTHFSKINVSYTVISLADNNNLERDIRAIYLKQKNHLQHFYLDGCFDSETVHSILKYTKQNADPESYYKFILIKDEAKEDNFVCSDQNQYPFRIETILLCYYGQHRHKINSPRLQDKINNLKMVTQKLKSTANFNETISKLNLQTYSYPFSKKCKLDNLAELKKILLDILNLKMSKKSVEQKQKMEFNLYGMLILRLQKIQTLGFLSEEDADIQVEALIKGSYPNIPVINFKK